MDAFRSLQAAAPDRHTQYAIRRFPRYFEVRSALWPGERYFDQHVRIIGAWLNKQLIGTVSLAQVHTNHESREMSEEESEAFWQAFSENDLREYQRLDHELTQTYIGSPPGSFLIHSLHVAADCRRQGIATRLLQDLLTGLSTKQSENLFMEMARVSSLQRFAEQLGFRCVKKTFSFTERFRFGCWGAILFQWNGLASRSV